MSSASEIRAINARNRAFRAAFAEAVERKDIQAVMRTAREMAPYVWGKDHHLWDTYYNAVRLCWTAPGAGYENRAITSRELTREHASVHVPSYE